MIKSDSKFQNKTFHIIRAYLDIFMMVWYVKIIFYPTNSVLASIIFIIKVFHSKELCNSIKLVEIFQYTVWCSCFHLVLSLSVLNIEPRTWYIHSYNPFLAQNLAKALLFIQTEKGSLYGVLWDAAWPGLPHSFPPAPVTAPRHISSFQLSILGLCAGCFYSDVTFSIRLTLIIHIYNWILPAPNPSLPSICLLFPVALIF